MSSNVLPWRCRSRCELEIVPIPGDGDWTRGLLDRIERESVVAIPHCHWADGSMLDLHQVSKACRDSNSSLVVDATQSMGVVPLDVDGPLARLDFVCASTHKWLLGPYGCSPLLVGPDRAGQAFPSSFVKDEHNLVGADDDDVLPFHQTPVYERHFDGGGRPNPVLLPMVAEGLRFILEDLGGPRNVSRHTAGLVAKALDLVGSTPQVKKKRAPHFFGIPSDNPRDCAAFLERERGVHVTGRLGFLRVAFHAYNTPRDVDALASALTDYHNAVS